MLAFILLKLIDAQLVPNVTGNCFTQRINFDPTRIYALAEPEDVALLNPAFYDIAIDYGSQNVRLENGQISPSVTLNRASGRGLGARLSTVRYVTYARITARMRAIPVPGIVTSFITMSARKDEIDVEIVGGDRTHFQTNIFYKGIQEFGIRGENNPINGNIDDSNEYVMDWKRSGITWFINGRQARFYSIDDPLTESSNAPGEKYFPSTPSQIQFGVWDGGGDPSPGVSAWAGGRVPWNDNVSFEANYEYIDIQCYDDNDNPVPKWPNTDDNPVSAVAPPSQPTSAANPAGAREGTDGSGSAIQVSIGPLQPLPNLPTASNNAMELCTNNWYYNLLLVLFL